MKTVCLLRHAKSAWDDASLDDVDRPLNDRGRDTASRMAGFMAAEKIVPDAIVCSAARRAIETLEHIAPALGQPDTRVEPDLYMASSDVILSMLHGLPETSESVLLIGHNPGIEEAALRLAGAGDAKLLERMERKYPTCTLAVIAFDTFDWSEIAEGRGRLERFVRGKDV